jgi:hypothetical protein
MPQALLIFGIAFASFCVWLVVRIINRRERWAKWTLGVTLSLPVLYVASFGPACWWFSSVSQLPIGNLAAFRRVSVFYRPIGWTTQRLPVPVARAVGWYATFGLKDETVECEIGVGDQYKIITFDKKS